jgi:hypothetical protein
VGVAVIGQALLGVGIRRTGALRPVPRESHRIGAGACRNPVDQAFRRAERGLGDGHRIGGGKGRDLHHDDPGGQLEARANEAAPMAQPVLGGIGGIEPRPDIVLRAAEHGAEIECRAHIVHRLARAQVLHHDLPVMRQRQHRIAATEDGGRGATDAGRCADRGLAPDREAELRGVLVGGEAPEIDGCDKARQQDAEQHRL